MQTILESEGVSKDAIICEDQSTTTLENIRNAKRLLPGRRVIIVTDRYHGGRALMVARHLRLEAEIDAPEMPKLPIKQYLREVLARPAYALKLRQVPRDD